MNSLEVLKFICDTCKCRLCVGKPIEGHSCLFNNMSSEYVHYIPTVDSEVAISIAAGVSYSGLSVAVFIEAYDLEYLVSKINRLDSVKETGILFITNSFVDVPYNQVYLNDFIAPFDGVVLSQSKHNVLIIKEGDLNA